MSKFGTNNYGGGFTKRNRYKLKDGDNVYRVLPAMGDLAEEGRWSVYYNVIFGFKTSDGKHQPFQSPEVKNRKTKMVEVPCAATDLIKKLKGQMEEAKKAGNKEQAAQLAKIVGDYPVMGVYSLNNDHYLNVVDRQGNVGQLELGHKAKVALENEIKRVRDTESFDPLSPDNGRFFNIRRTGMGRDTSVQVTVVKQKINIPGVGDVEKDIVHTIDDTLSERLLTKKNGKWVYKEAADLTKLFKRPTAEEVALIVKAVDILTGKSTGIDQVFPRNQTNTQTETDDSAEQETSEANSATSAANTGGNSGTYANQQNVGVAAGTAPSPNGGAGPVTTAVSGLPQTNTTSVVQETKAANATETAPKTDAPKTTAEAVAAMTPDEFMKQMGINL